MFEHSIAKKRLLGATALIAGTGIGAGMLALPVKTAALGFSLSVALFILVWLLMLGTGWIYITLFLKYPAHTNLLALTGFLLGPVGRYLIWFLYLVLFYSLLVAYTTAFGEIIPAIVQFPLERNHAIFISSALLTAALLGGTIMVDRLNRFLVLGLVTTFGGFLWFGCSYIRSENLLAPPTAETLYPPILAAIPLLITTFGYHGIIPTVVNYLGGSKLYLKKALLYGTLATLIVYLLWQFFIMGIVPNQAPYGLLWAQEQGATALLALEKQTGFAWVELLGFWFAFFAVTTSYFGVALGLCDFLIDGLKLRNSFKTRLPLVILISFTPTIFAISDPTLFLTALSYGGVIGSLLFIVVPIVLALRARML
jgi:tyrosine-specific transport protein